MFHNIWHRRGGSRLYEYLTYVLRVCRTSDSIGSLYAHLHRIILVRCMDRFRQTTASSAADFTKYKVQNNSRLKVWWTRGRYTQNFKFLFFACWSDLRKRWLHLWKSWFWSTKYAVTIDSDKDFWNYGQRNMSRQMTVFMKKWNTVNRIRTIGWLKKKNVE